MFIEQFHTILPEGVKSFDIPYGNTGRKEEWGVVISHQFLEVVQVSPKA